MLKAPQIMIVAKDQTAARPFRDMIEAIGAKTKLFTRGVPGRVSELLNGSNALMLTCSIGQEFEEADCREEIALLRDALNQNLPILAICTGMHLLNVAFGGSLIQNIPGHSGSIAFDGTVEPIFHTTYLSPGSKLAAILGSGGFVRLNSIHKHGLREPQKSPELMATAYSVDDGIIEGLESPAHDWVIGVQCHPERKREVPGSFRRLFQAFVERAESRL
jgi:putative glutamine amidotransferase